MLKSVNERTTITDGLYFSLQRDRRLAIYVNKKLSKNNKIVPSVTERAKE
ncbi:hypothetical protein HJ01_01286 [Flavobacterium frigoris PS1]|uniref:Uncharacterized protein n=1 Tax=Flavobacterium frigoris (strain PS1) TaxID=1086011 RepID=H7FQ26_FLAFP|nr:hypothetical protein HJ01_01286 [Flavobacterium frigoris PS1]